VNRIDWLDRYAPGLQALTPEEREVITHFSFLWTMFEARVLSTRASANAIVEASQRWAGNGLLAPDTFGQEVAYFRDRYVADGKFTYHFNHLHLRRNDASALVRKVLAGEATEPEEVAAAVLIIVYRFRNNLFHGVKWSYELQGQLENFTHANTALMQAIELYEKAEPGMRA
jgi:hypothetical protein